MTLQYCGLHLIGHSHYLSHLVKRCLHECSSSAEENKLSCRHKFLFPHLPSKAIGKWLFIIHPISWHEQKYENIMRETAAPIITLAIQGFLKYFSSHLHCKHLFYRTFLKNIPLVYYWFFTPVFSLIAGWLSESCCFELLRYFLELITTCDVFGKANESE